MQAAPAFSWPTVWFWEVAPEEEMVGQKRGDYGLQALPLKDCHNGMMAVRAAREDRDVLRGSWVWGPVYHWPSLPVEVPLPIL